MDKEERGGRGEEDRGKMGRKKEGRGGSGEEEGKMEEGEEL